MATTNTVKIEMKTSFVLNDSLFGVHNKTIIHELTDWATTPDEI